MKRALICGISGQDGPYLAELDWQNHVVVDETYSRPTDIKANFTNPGKAHILLDWKAKSAMHDVARMMVAAERSKIAHIMLD